MVDEAFLKNDVPYSVHVILSISAAFIRAARVLRLIRLEPNMFPHNKQ